MIYKLKKNEIQVSAEGINVKLEGVEQGLIFPKNRQKLLQLLDGSNSVKNIWEKLQESDDNIRLSEIYLTIEKLKKSNAFEGMNEKKVKNNKFDSLIFAKLPIISESVNFFKNSWLFYTSAFVVCMTALMAIVLYYKNLSFDGFLKFSDSYLLALPALLLMFSILSLAKAIVQLLLLSVASGRVPTLSVQLDFFGLSFAVGENELFRMGKIDSGIYKLAKTLSYLATAAFFVYFFNNEFSRQIAIVAVFLTLIKFNPYRPSEATDLVETFIDDEEMRYLLPYLKNKSLVSFAKKSANYKSENKLIAFSCLALAWLFVFIGFCQDLINQNMGFWFFSIESAPIIEKISIGTVLTGLIICTLMLVFSLAQTIISNLISPFSTQVKSIMQRFKSKEVVDYKRENLRNFFTEISFFDKTKIEDIHKLADGAVIKSFAKEAPIIFEGETGNEMFIVLSGKVRIERLQANGYTQVYAHLEKGAVFGEIGLIEKCVRTADVTAEDDVIVAVISENLFKSVWSDFKDSSARAILNRISLSRFLSDSAIFKCLPKETAQLFLEKGSFVQYEAQDYIVKQGDDEKAFYMLLEGRVQVVKDSKKLVELSHGDFFGEISLFNKVKRTANVQALEKSALLKIEKNAFWDVVAENMDLAFNLEIISEERRSVS